MQDMTTYFVFEPPQKNISSASREKMKVDEINNIMLLYRPYKLKVKKWKSSNKKSS